MVNCSELERVVEPPAIPKRFRGEKTLLIVFLSFLIGCSSQEVPLSAAISRVVAQGEGATLRFADLAQFSWTHLFVFPPYSSRTKIEKELGFKWREVEDSGIESDEGHTLLVFVEKDQVVKSLMHPRNEGDFAELEKAGGYGRKEAVFVVKKQPDGWLVVRWE